MYDISAIGTVICISFLVFILFKKYEDKNSLQLITILFSILIQGCIYIYIILAGGTANFTLITLKLPYPTVFFLALFVLSIHKYNKLSDILRHLIAYIIIINVSMLKSPDFIVALASNGYNVAVQNLYFAILVVPFTISLLIPLSLYYIPGTTIYKAYFLLNWRLVLSNLKILIACFIFYLLIFWLYHILNSLVIQIQILPSIGFAIKYAILIVFFSILIDHTVLQLIPYFIIKNVFKSELSDSKLAITLAIIYALGFLPNGLIYMMWTLVYGLVLSYLFIKTKSLSPGIIIKAIFVIFFV